MKIAFAVIVACWLALVELGLYLAPSCEVVFMTPIVRGLEVGMLALLAVVALPERRRERLPRARVL